MPVVDASVVVEYLAASGKAEQAEEVLSHRRDELYAPHLIDAEVGHALRRLALVGAVEPAVAEASLADLADLPLWRSPHTFLMEAAWAMRETVSFYDALYLALAVELEQPLVTADRKLARSAERVGVETELL